MSKLSDVVQGIAQGIAGMFGGSNKQAALPAITQTQDPIPEPPIPDQSTAMNRRMDEANQDPAQQVTIGLGHLKQVGGGLDPDTFNAVLEPLLRAKHFGQGGGMQPGGQGQIISPKAGGGQSLGSVVGTVAAIA